MSVNEFALRPTAGKLIVLVDKEDEKTAGGLYKPDTAIEPANLATVLATDGMGVAQVSDRVLIGRYAGVSVDYEGTTYVILKHDDILAIVSRAPVEVTGVHA